MEILVKDTSAKSKITNISTGPDPDLDFTVGKDCIKFLGRDKSGLNFEFFIISRDATSNNINLKIGGGTVNLSGKYKPFGSNLQVLDTITRLVRI